MGMLNLLHNTFTTPAKVGVQRGGLAAAFINTPLRACLDTGFRRYGAIFGFLLLTSIPASADTFYSAIIEDLPLMPGMVEKTEEAVMFDKPDGRIIETVAATTASTAEVTKFYAATLPPLGWKPSARSAFTRDGETLQLDIEQKNGTAYIHFSVTPNEGK